MFIVSPTIQLLVYNDMGRTSKCFENMLSLTYFCKHGHERYRRHVTHSTPTSTMNTATSEAALASIEAGVIVAVVVLSAAAMKRKKIIFDRSRRR